MRPRISLVASFSGDSHTISTAIASASSTPAKSVRSASRMLRSSKVARPIPSWMIGPINGEISIAPMITATEFCSSPSIAMPQDITIMKP